MATKRPKNSRHAKRAAGKEKHRKATKQAKRPAVHRRKGRAPTSANAQTTAPAPAPYSFEEAVLRNIANNSNGKGKNVPDEAMLATSTLSSLSGGMKELHYKSGMQIGRALYKMDGAGKEYTFPEESIADLVAFFEKSGHKNVTYNALPGKFEIKLHSKGPSIGTNLHDFEAGIIAGYMSSANHRLVNISESECVHDNGTACKFVVSDCVKRTAPDSVATVNNLAEHISRQVNSRQHNGHTVVNGYYSLASSLLMDGAYAGPLSQIAGYLGKNIGSRISARQNKAAKLAQAIRLLNLGIPEVISSKPLRMRVSFGSLDSRKEFVDLSLAFINGLLSTQLQNDAVAVERTAKGAYVVDIREKAI